MDGKGSDPKQGYINTYVRILIADSVTIMDESRREMACESGITDTALTVLNSLFELSINTYTSVSKKIQSIRRSQLDFWDTFYLILCL